MSHFQSGANIDIRPQEEKLKDYKLEELVAGVDPVDWREKPMDQWRKFPIINQANSGSCVAQTEGKEMGIIRYLTDGNYVHFSATDIYQRRANRPQSGMNAVDARQIIATGGATLEVLTPSQGMNDAQMDAVVVEPYKREVGNVFKVPNYVELPAKDIDTIASVIQRTQKGIMLWFYFGTGEWDQRPRVLYPNLDLRAPGTARHSTTGVDFTLVSGNKKAIIIDDSYIPESGIDGKGQRIIDEDFFKARNWHASYLINFRFQDQTTQPPATPISKPHHTFNVDLEFSAVVIYLSEVSALQNCLKYEGLFPINIASTGYFGALTKKAVQAFQIKYGISNAASGGFGRVGPKTRAKLNALYS